MSLELFMYETVILSFGYGTVNEDRAAIFHQENKLLMIVADGSGGSAEVFRQPNQQSALQKNH